MFVELEYEYAQGNIQLIKSDSKDFYIITKNPIKCCSSELSTHQCILKKVSRFPQNYKAAQL